MELWTGFIQTLASECEHTYLHLCQFPRSAFAAAWMLSTRNMRKRFEAYTTLHRILFVWTFQSSLISCLAILTEFAWIGSCQWYSCVHVWCLRIQPFSEWEAMNFISSWAGLFIKHVKIKLPLVKWRRFSANLDSWIRRHDQVLRRNLYECLEILRYFSIPPRCRLPAFWFSAKGFREQFAREHECGCLSQLSFDIFLLRSESVPCKS